MTNAWLDQWTKHTLTAKYDCVNMDEQNGSVMPDMLPVDEAEVTERATRRIAALLEKPEDLERLHDIVAQTQARVKDVESKLHTRLQAQLDGGRRAISVIGRTQDDLDSIRDKLQQAEDVYDNCHPLQSVAAELRSRADTRNQLRGTLDQLDLIFGVPERLGEVKELLNETPPNLLLIHRHIQQLEACFDHVMERMHATNASTTGKRALESYFADVFKAAAQFQDMLLDITHDILELDRELPAVIVSTLRIIEREEVVDKRRSRPKGLKARFMQQLDEAIDQRFVKYFGSSPGRVSRFLSQFEEFYFDDLLQVQASLQRRFPPSYEILDFFVRGYHNRLCTRVDALQASSDIEPNEIMLLLNWAPVYKNTFKVKLGVDVDTLEKRLLGSNEEEMRQNYLAVLGGKFAQWVSNLVSTEIRDWFKPPPEDDEAASKESPPPQTGDGLYFTDTPVILFQMIDQQLRVAFQPGGGREFARRLVDMCLDNMGRFQDAYKDALAKVVMAFTGDKAQPGPQFLLEYMISGVNNNNKCKTHSDQILRTVGEHLAMQSADYLEIEERVAKLSEGFGEVADSAADVVSKLAVEDCKLFFNNMYNIQWMRSRKPFKRVIATLRDYLEQCSNHMQSSHYGKVAVLTLHRALAQQLTVLMQRRDLVKSEESFNGFIENFEREMDMLEALLDAPDVRTDTLDRRPLRVLKLIHQIFVANKSLISANWQKLRQDFPDASFQHLECLLCHRADMSPKDARNYIKNNVVGKLDDVEPDDLGEGRTTVFSLVTPPTNTTYT